LIARQPHVALLVRAADLALDAAGDAPVRPRIAEEAASAYGPAHHARTVTARIARPRAPGDNADGVVVARIGPTRGGLGDDEPVRDVGIGVPREISRRVGGSPSVTGAWQQERSVPRTRRASGYDERRCDNLPRANHGPHPTRTAEAACRNGAPAALLAAWQANGRGFKRQDAVAPWEIATSSYRLGVLAFQILWSGRCYMIVTMKLLVVALVLAGLVPGADGAAAEGARDTCRPLPPGKRVVKLSLKPETTIEDLISWISSITCKQFLVPGSIDVRAKKVTIISPALITAAEAYQLFIDALDSVDLTVVRTGRFLRVIETAKAKTQPIPFYVGDSRSPL
jgi:hypothetical protein